MRSLFLLLLMTTGLFGQGSGWQGYVELNLTDSTVTGFTEPVSLNDFPTEFWTFVESNGDDIRVTDENDAPLPHNVAHFVDSGTTGSGVLFVYCANANDSDARLRVWAGNPEADEQTEEAGEDAFDDDVALMLPWGLGTDLTQYDNDTTNTGSPTVAGQNGPIAGTFSTAFNGSTQYGLATAYAPPQHPSTLFASFYVTNLTGDYNMMSLADTAVTNNYIRIMFINSGDRFRLNSNGGTTRSVDSSTSPTATTWYTAAAYQTNAFSRGVRAFGATVTSAVNSGTHTGEDTFAVGCVYTTSAGNFFNGRLSMMRFDRVVRSVDYIDRWIAALADSDQSDYRATPTWVQTYVEDEDNLVPVLIDQRRRRN